jgi:hypothetical protein
LKSSFDQHSKDKGNDDSNVLFSLETFVGDRRRHSGSQIGPGSVYDTQQQQQKKQLFGSSTNQESFFVEGKL